MLFYTVGQSRIFLTMIYAGMLIGAYAMLDGAARRLFEAGRLLSLLLDLLFGTIAACIVICALLAAADGELRLYALLGIVCGYVLFMSTLARLIPRLIKLLVKPLEWLLHALSRCRLLRRILR